MFSLLPSITSFESIEMHFSFDKDGLIIAELDEIWRQPSRASLLVVETETCNIGVFFDRTLTEMEKIVTSSSCKLFKYSNDLEIFQHCETNKLRYKFIPRKGIVIGNDLYFLCRETAIKIEYSLLDASTKKTNVFNNPQLIENIFFQIYNLELFLLK